MNDRPSVWAPLPERVELFVGGERHAMERDERGWWTAAIDLAPGTDYGFVLDDGPPIPGPRTRWQPYGVKGLSRTLDHDAFDWSDAGFTARPLAEAVIYEMHVGTFTAGGTFDSAIDRLGDLVDLGISHLEIMPVAEFSGDRGWGYDGVHLYAPHHAYGGPDGLKRLVDRAHEAGLAVLLDVVYNHLGPEGNHLRSYGPYFTSKYATPWGDAVNFDDAGSHEVRRFVIDNALMWMRDYHSDGLRLDAVHAIFDQSAVLILAGAEWGATSPFRYFTGHDSPELARAVSQGRRAEFADFGWEPDQVPDPQDPDAFAASNLDWSERTREPHVGLLGWYRDLLALRAATSALRDGDRSAVRVTHDADAGWILVERGPISVAANLGAAAVDLEVEGVARLAWPPDVPVEVGRVRLPPDGVVVLERPA